MNADVIGDAGADWFTATTADGPMRVYRAHPTAPVAPVAAVIVLQEAFGVNAHIQDVTRRVAALGYLALAPELFHRTGGGTVDYSDHGAAMPLINAITPGQIKTDIAAVIEYLSRNDGIAAGRIGVVGFCFGGRAAVTAATAIPGIAVTVAFYGPGVAAGPHAVLDQFANIGGPVLMFVGDQDVTIPAAHVDAIQDASRKAGADVRVEVFAGAGHAFHCDARPSMYNAPAAVRAWQMTVELLDKTLGE